MVGRCVGIMSIFVFFVFFTRYIHQLPFCILILIQRYRPFILVQIQFILQCIMLKKDSPPIQAFDQLKLEHNELEEFKQKFQQQYGQASKYGEYYIGHPNLKLLFCFLLFAFADENVMNTKYCKKMMKKLFQGKDFEQSDQLKTMKTKFYLRWDNKKSLVKRLVERSNSIALNKLLLLQKCEKLKEDQWISLMKTVFGCMSKYIACKLTYEDRDEDLNTSKDPNIYLTILVTNAKSYLIFYQKQSDELIKSEITENQEKRQKQSNELIRSEITENEEKRQKQSNELIRSEITDNEEKRQKQEQIEIRSSRDSKKEQTTIFDQNERKSTKIEKSQTMQEISGGETQIQPRSMKQIKKSLSEGDKDNIVDSVEDIQNNDFTWFEALILVIILATILAGYFNIFDPFLKDYNVKIGRYYMLDAGYKFVNYTVEMANHYYSKL